jgi:hypothetical protein
VTTAPELLPLDPPVPPELLEDVPLLDPDPLPDSDPLLEPELDPLLEPELGPLPDPELDPLLDPELDPELDPLLEPDPEPLLGPEPLLDPMPTSFDASGVPTPVGPSHPTPARHMMSEQKPL